MPTRKYLGPIIQAFVERSSEVVAAPERKGKQTMDGKDHITAMYDGDHVWSYDTCIATVDRFGAVVINMQEYSATTSTLQQRLVHAVSEHFQSVQYVFTASKRISPSQLVQRAYAGDGDLSQFLTGAHIRSYSDVTTLQRLAKEARESASFRGHKMQKFIRLSKFTQVSRCELCGMEVVVNARPAPNEIDVSGEAVALGCRPRGK